MKKIIALVAAAGLSMSLAACGGDGGGDGDGVSQEDFKNGLAQAFAATGMTEGFTGGELTAEQEQQVLDAYTSCLAEEAYPNISADGREKVAAQQLEAEFSEADDTALNDAMVACEPTIEDAMAGIVGGE